MTKALLVIDLQNDYFPEANFLFGTSRRKVHAHRPRQAAVLRPVYSEPYPDACRRNNSVSTPAK